MSRDKFILQPTEACTTTFSIGPRGCGKTFIALESIKIWLSQNVFTHLFLVLPDFKDEQHDSYGWLTPHKNVTVYESYNTKIGKEILERADKNFEEHKSKNVPLEKYLLFIDDATGQGKQLMRCEHLVKLSTSARHKRCHTWFCIHATAGIIPPKIRYMTGYIFIYDVHKEHLKTLYKEFINFPKDFKNFKEFDAFFDEYVRSRDHGCLLINHQYKPHNYSPWVSEWFSQ